LDVAGLRGRRTDLTFGVGDIARWVPATVRFAEVFAKWKRDEPATHVAYTDAGVSRCPLYDQVAGHLAPRPANRRPYRPTWSRRGLARLAGIGVTVASSRR